MDKNIDGPVIFVITCLTVIIFVMGIFPHTQFQSYSYLKKKSNDFKVQVYAQPKHFEANSLKNISTEF